MGLSMFIPLLQAVSQETNISQNPSLGHLKFLTDFIQAAGFNLTITSVLIALVLLFISKGLMRYWQLTYYAGMRQYFIKKVRGNLIDHLQNLSFSAFLKMDAGKIHNTLTVEVQRLFQTMRFYFDAAQSIVMLLTYMILAFLANYQFAVLVGIGAFLSNFLYRKIYAATKKASIALSRKGSDFNSFISQTTLHFKYLKSTNTFEKLAAKLKTVINDSEFLNRRIGKKNAITTSVKEPMIVIIVTLVILIQINWMAASIHSIILSLLLFYRALSFLVSIQNHWQGFIENIGGMNAVAETTEEMAALKEISGGIKFETIRKHIILRDVDLHFDTMQVLHSVNIIIPRKQTIALIGETGSGKTTIANLIAGLIKPGKGEIFIDGVSLSSMDLDSYRSQIGYISQESVIFNDSIFNNVTFWEEPTPENIKKFKEVTAIALLTNFIESQPLKEESPLGDNGLLISGGQRQRISIARELYKNTEILIFDEATSALDSETEKAIQENIEKLYGNFTLILIAHRLSTIKKADKIYLLEEGRISDSGSFEEMMQTSSRFKKMVALQGLQYT